MFTLHKVVVTGGHRGEARLLGDPGQIEHLAIRVPAVPIPQDRQRASEFHATPGL
jgi:hypothetical protein